MIPVVPKQNWRGSPLADIVALSYRVIISDSRDLPSPSRNLIQVLNPLRPTFIVNLIVISFLFLSLANSYLGMSLGSISSRPTRWIQKRPPSPSKAMYARSRVQVPASINKHPSQILFPQTQEFLSLSERWSASTKASMSESPLLKSASRQTMSCTTTCRLQKRLQMT